MVMLIVCLGWCAQQVVVYIDGVRVGEALALEETPHHIIHRLCELDLAVSELEQPPRQKGVGFRLKLPNLTEGKHEVGASVCNFLQPKSAADFLFSIDSPI